MFIIINLIFVLLCIVGIIAENGTARVNEDFGHWYAPTIQFNPGNKTFRYW
jgi:hypothetical protein